MKPKLKLTASSGGFVLMPLFAAAQVVTFVDLHPTEASDCDLFAITANQQAGSAVFGENEHASIWSGAAESFVDLNPPGAVASYLLATTGSQQAGILPSV
jgi:hypothetical protein